MSTARNFGPVAEQMTQALERYSKEELIDLLTHLVKTYVVEGTLPLKPEVGTISGDEHLARLSFPQLVLHLQMRLDHREWTLFAVSGEDVWVTQGNRRINLTGRPSSSPTTPPLEGGAAEPPTEPRSGAPAPAPSSAAPSEPAPAEPEPVAPGDQARTRVPEPFAEDIEASERFGMLEID